MIVCDLFRVGTAGADGDPQHALCRAVRALFCTVLPGDTFVLGSAIGNITYQASQILGFVAGAAVVAVLDPHKTLGIDAATPSPGCTPCKGSASWPAARWHS